MLFYSNYLFYFIKWFNQMVNFIKVTITEEKILEAARQVFLKKGMDGARMQEIADEAGINKALLHYYYRSKDKLFEAVFNEIFTQLIIKVSPVLLSNAPVKEKINLFIDSFIDKIASIYNWRN